MIVVLIIAGLLFIAEIILQSVLKTRIENAVNQKATPYHLSVKKVSLSFLRSSCTISGFQLTTDTSSLQQHAKDSAGFLAVNGTVAEMEVKNISWINILFQKKLTADEIILSGIRLSSVQHSPGKALKKAKKSLQFSLPFAIAVKRLGLSIDSLNMKDNTQAASKNDLILTNGNLLFGLASLNQHDTFTLKSLEKIDFSISQTIYITNDSFYTFKAKNARYLDSSQSLNADSLLLLPNYGEEAFAKRHKVESDRIKVSTHGFAITGFQLSDYLMNKKLIAKKITVGHLLVNVFRDKRMPEDHSKKLMPQELLYDYHHLINIDSVQVKNGFVEYKEIAENGSEPGRIFFSNLNASLSNVTNDSIYKNQKDTTRLAATALLMDKSKITINMLIPVYNHDNSISCSGSLGALKATDLNPFTKNDAFIALTAGKINSLNYHFTENNDHAGGTLIMLYDSLNLALINKTTKDTSGLKEKLLSFFAKKVIIQPSNPLKGKPVREGLIDYDRNPEKFIINYTWKSILSGLKSSIVVGADKPASRNKS